MPHQQSLSPFSATSRAARIQELAPPESGPFGGLFGPTRAGRVSNAARSSAAGALLDRERSTQLLNRFQSAIKEGQAAGLPLGVAVNRALADNPELLLDKDLFSSVETFRNAFQEKTIKAGRGERIIGVQPGSGAADVISGSEPRAAIAAPAGTQLKSPVSGENLGGQVPFKPTPPPDKVRIVQAAVEARKNGNIELADKLETIILSDTTTDLQKNAKALSDARRKAGELEAKGDKSGAEAQRAVAQAIAADLQGKLDFMTALVGSALGKPGGGAGGGAAGSAIETGDIAPNPAVVAGTPGDPGAELTLIDQQVLALPPNQLTEEVVSRMSPAGLAALKARFARPQQGVPGAPGAQINAPTIGTPVPPTAR